MSLFIGRLNNDVRTKDLQELFGKYGTLKRCETKGTFGFLTFDDERDAEEAMEELQGREIRGARYVL